MSVAMDGAVVVLASACAAGALVTWLSILVALHRRGAPRLALLAALVVPAAPVAWREGLRKRAAALVVLALLYGLLRITFG